MTGRQARSIFTEAAIRSCAERGLTPKQASEEICIGLAAVYAHARQHGIIFDRKGKHDDAIRSLAEQGKTRTEISAVLGVAGSTVSSRVRALGLSVPRHQIERHSGSATRAEAMASMYRAGKTLEEIGSLYKITRERVRQIIKREHGLVGADGGQTVRADIARRERASKKDQEYMEKLGCDFADYKRIRDLGRELVEAGESVWRTPLRAFISQKNNAKTRGLNWSLKFWDWWDIWQKSGHWDKRGRGRDGYVMCRFADAGSYDAGNVYIATALHNGSFQPNNPYRKGHKDHALVMLDLAKKRILRDLERTEAKRNRKYSDLPLGVTRHALTGRFQAQASLGGKHTYLGMFSTPEEAHAVYLAARQNYYTQSLSQLSRAA